MVEPTPAPWRDTCERCGKPFSAGEPRWIEQRRYTVHTRCARWESWPKPPYAWKLKELRKHYRASTGQRRTRIVRAGRAIRAAERVWPEHAVEHVERMLDAIRALD